MKRVILLSMLATLSAWSLAQEAAPEAIQEEVAEVREAWVDAYAAGDAAAVAELYAPDAVFHDATGEVAQGREAIRQAFEEALTEDGELRGWAPVETLALGDDVIEIGRWATPDEAQPDGAYQAVVFSEREGEWHITHHYADGTAPTEPGALAD